MFLSISGRQQSGKTSMSNMMREIFKFKKGSMADGLKDYLSQLYDWNLTDLNTEEGKSSILPYPVTWDEKSCSKLSKIINIHIPFEEKKELNTRREALQYIGTNILRKLDPDFHIKEFEKRYKSGKIVCDDVRFQNELNFFKSKNAFCTFIFRPYHTVYSNHDSEISLNRRYFNYVFCNYKTIESLEKTFKSTIIQKEIYLYPPNPQNTMFLDINKESAFFAGFISSCYKVEKQKNKYVYSIQSNNKSIIKKLCKFMNIEYCKNLKIDSLYIIEDLKIWNIDTSGKIEIPSVVISSGLTQDWNDGYNSNM